MLIVQSYPLAVAMCIITMLCWGSWANTQKLASKEWRFQLFYWDYAIGVLLLALGAGLHAGQHGQRRAPVPGRSASGRGQMARLGVAGRSDLQPVEHPAGGGDRHRGPGRGLSRSASDWPWCWASSRPTWRPRRATCPCSALGVGGIMIAILLDALAYKRLAGSGRKTPVKGIVISVAAGLLMGWFYSFVAQSMGKIDPSSQVLEAGKLSPYTAIVSSPPGCWRRTSSGTRS